MMPMQGDRLATRGLAFGVLSGVVLAANESIALPLDALSAADEAAALLDIMLEWTFVSAGLAWAALALEQRRVPLRFSAPALLALMLALCGVIAAAWAVENAFGYQPVVAKISGGVYPSWDGFFYVFSGATIAGPIVVATCVLSMRVDRSRLLLGRAELARSDARRRLSEAQFDAARTRIEPDFMFEAIDEIRRRYEDDPDTADALLDELVAFLREAMPAVRGAASTLDAEVQTAQAFARLATHLETRRVDWTFDLPQVLPATPFPSLLLLPLLERWTPPPGITLEHERGLLSFTGTSREWTVVVERRGREPRLPTPVEYRLRVALAALLGPACEIAVDSTAPDAVQIVLRYRAPAVAAADDAPSSAIVPTPIPLREARP